MRFCLSFCASTVIIFTMTVSLTTISALDVSSLDVLLDRRSALVSAGQALSWTSAVPLVSESISSRATNEGMKLAPPTSSSRLQVVTDPNTYSALAYAPPIANDDTPLILVLHGSGKNEKNIREDLASPIGEHAGLIPSLLEGGTAPKVLREEFCVLAPYSFGQANFYNEPRGKLLQFVDWAIQNQNTEALPIRFSPKKLILFGFSDGATVAVELLTTRRFTAGVVCSYGFSGQVLPAKALERLSNLPIWVFHSQDDVIFDVQYSDRLVRQLQSVNNNGPNDGAMIRYSRFDSDPEKLPPRVRGHSMGTVASKDPKVFEWMLQQVSQQAAQP